MKNKEIMDRLQAYYLTQDPVVIARCLASLMVDINRLAHFDSLEEKEAICLQERLDLLVEELHRFILEGPRHDIVMVKMNSDEM